MLPDAAERKKSLFNSLAQSKPAVSTQTNSSDCVTYVFPSWELQKKEKNKAEKTGEKKLQKTELIETVNKKDAKESIALSRDIAGAYERGFEEGRQSAIEELEKEFEEKLHAEQRVTLIKTIGQLETLIANIQKEFFQLQAKSEEVVLKFALAVAQQILKREVLCDNSIVLNQLRESLRRVLGVENIKVRVNPEDEAIVRENKPAILSASDSLREIVIESDDKVERGGCILESESGNVDARISTQMKKIEAALIDDGVLITQ